MKTERNILIAFILNLGFAIFEFVGGIWTGSIAIASDAVHDLGDALSIGMSYLLERIGKKRPDGKHTWGYARYSVLGSLLTTVILLIGSVWVIINAVHKIFVMPEIHYDGVIIFALIGVCVNLLAVFVTKDGDSLNQKAVNLHMLEDVLGWIVVLIGAVVMRFTGFSLIDPLLSICVAVYILIHACGNLKEITALFLLKAPHEIDVGMLEEQIRKLPEVQDVHQIRIWSMDGQEHLGQMHIVTDGDAYTVKQQIRQLLQEYGIAHITLETERGTEQCQEQEDHSTHACRCCGHHHRHHHHHHH